MKTLRFVLIVAVAATVLAFLYTQAQLWILDFGLVSQEWLRSLAVNPPIGGEIAVLAIMGGVFFLEVFLATLIAALPAGILVGLSASNRPVAHAVVAALLAALGLFATTYFLIMRPRYIPGWVAYPGMVGLLAAVMAGWAYLTSRLTSRSSTFRP